MGFLDKPNILTDIFFLFLTSNLEDHTIIINKASGSKVDVLNCLHCLFWFSLYLEIKISAVTLFSHCRPQNGASLRRRSCC